MLTALGVAVGLIVAALGVNLVRQAPEDASAERWVLRQWFFGSPDWMEPWRRWTNRALGACFVAFGLAICVGACIAPFI